MTLEIKKIESRCFPQAGGGQHIEFVPGDRWGTAPPWRPGFRPSSQGAPRGEARSPAQGQWFAARTKNL